MIGKKRFLLGILFLTITVNTIVLASAADVAYIVTTPDEIKPEFISVLNELHFTYDIVKYNEVNSYNFSTARLILLNNEYFPNWADIPVNDFPAVVANGRNMDEWGWAKRVTSSSQEVPIKISVNTTHEVGMNFDPVITSYTEIGPDIYYLDKKDVFNGLEIIASNVFDHEDAVVAVAKAGTILTKAGYPDTYVNADTCFFGVTESEYWTNETRDLFKSCVDFVSVDCFDDSYCPDEPLGEPYCSGNNVFQDVMDFYCQNPGTSVSMCVDDTISILLADCGEDYCDGWGGDYCGIDGNVYTSRTCYDMGCAGTGECFKTPFVEEVLVDDCDDIYESCSNGVCGDLEIECDSNLDCGTNQWLGETSCQNDEVYDNYLSFSCIGAGTPNSYCTNSTEFLLREDCPDYCASGSCVDCTQDSHCPDDSVLGSYCSGGDVFHDVVSYSCLGYECISETTPELEDKCLAGEICYSEECSEVTCSSNSDCGINGFEDWTYCDSSLGNSYKNFVSYTCNNPGTIGSYCSDYSLPILIEYCGFACVSGECVDCFNNLNCGEDGYIGDPYCSLDGKDLLQLYEAFSCSSPGLPESECSSEINEVVVESCLDVCVSGECVDIICDSDSDCDDLDSGTIDSCHNPGELSSYCTNEPVECFDDWDCDDSNIWTGDQCINPGLVSSYCENTPIECFVDSDCNDLDDLTIDECHNAGLVTSYCTNEVITCNSDSDCDDGGYVGGPVCDFDDIFRDFEEAMCIDSGLVTSYCGFNIVSHYIDSCPYACDSGVCVRCDEDSDCDDNYDLTDDVCINPDTILSACENTFTGDCYPGETRSCGESNIGECSFGTETCQADGTWGYCVGAVYPETEVCNDLDDDCDGNTDEGGVCVPTCQDECTLSGETQCINDSEFRVCGYFDFDECLEWSDPNICGFGFICEGNECVESPQ